MPVFQVIEVGETPYLYVEKKSSMEPGDISQRMGEALAEVWAFMQQKGLAPIGGALSVYYTYDPEKMTFRAGFSVDRRKLGQAEGAVKGDVTPAGRVLHFVHKGSYATLRDDYGKMMAQLAERKLTLGAPTWEVYMNDPATVPESELLTEVFCTLA